MAENRTSSLVSDKQKRMGAKIWILITLCMVVGVGLGMAVYQKSLTPKTIVSTATPMPVATVRPSRLPVSSSKPSPVVKESAIPAEIDWTESVLGTSSASESASASSSATATASARVTRPEGEELPDAGVFEVTMGVLGMGMVWVLLGVLGLWVI